MFLIYFKDTNVSLALTLNDARASFIQFFDATSMRDIAPNSVKSLYNFAITITIDKSTIDHSLTEVISEARSASRAPLTYARYSRAITCYAPRRLGFLGFLRRGERGRKHAHRIRFACKLANAHHRRPSALDCRSRER